MTLRTRIYKKIQRRGRRRLPSGSFGTYYQISAKKGIKLYIGACDPDDEYLQHVLKCAYNEVYAYREARKRYPFVPKCYGVQVIKTKYGFQVGIILQHLGDKTLADVGYGRIHEYDESRSSSPFKNRYPCDELSKQLADKGIYHGDLHGRNLMYYRHKLWVIDFGMTIFEPRKHANTVN